MEQLTTSQQQMVQDAVGDGTDFPRFTDDPQVNHRVDQILGLVPAWEELSAVEQQLYREEVEAARRDS